MTSDTPSLLTDFKRSAFSYTGAVFMGFEADAKVFLTWLQRDRDMGLDISATLGWARWSLDRVRVDPSEPWWGLEGSTLTGVELYTGPCIEADRVLAVRHLLQTDEGPRTFWVGVGGADFVGDHDDLWVGVDVDPANISDLRKVGMISAPT